MAALPPRIDWPFTPSMAPPPGETSNLIDPPSIAYIVTNTNIVCGVIFISFSTLRLYTRAFIVRTLGWDDYACILAVIAWIAELTCCQLQVPNGIGVHLWNVPLSKFSPHFLLTWALDGALFIVTMCFIKFSILILYRRLFISRGFLICWWLIAFYTAGFTIGGSIVSILTCRPVEAAWNITVHSTYCINIGAFYTCIGVVNAVGDVLILALPIPSVLALSLKRKQKIVLIILFSIGSGSCFMGIVSIKSVLPYVHGTTDVTYYLVDVGVWTQIQMTVGMVSACVPALRPFFDRYFSKWLGTWFHSSDAYMSRELHELRSTRETPKDSVALPTYSNQIQTLEYFKSKNAKTSLFNLDSDSTNRIMQDV